MRIIEQRHALCRIAAGISLRQHRPLNNTSVALIPIALCEATEQGRTKVGDTRAFVAFRAGPTWAAAVVKLGERAASVSMENGQECRKAYSL